MNEETIQAAREAFKRDPETACRAMLDCSSEELFVQALKGCNQYGHKPGCPDADGGGGDKKSNNDVYWLYNNSDGKMEPVSEDEMNDFIDQGLTTATITSDENGLTIEAGEDKRTLKFGSGKNAQEDLSRQREFIAKAFGSFNWERDGKQFYDDDALDKVIKMAKHNKSVSLAVFGDWED